MSTEDRPRARRAVATAVLRGDANARLHEQGQKSEGLVAKGRCSYSNRFLHLCELLVNMLDKRFNRCNQRRDVKLLR